jgi:hypothetical protein
MRCSDVMVRTTLNLDSDVIDAAWALADAEGRSLGGVVSDLARRGLLPQESSLDDEDGFPVFRVGARGRRSPPGRWPRRRRRRGDRPPRRQSPGQPGASGQRVAERPPPGPGAEEDLLHRVLGFPASRRMVTTMPKSRPASPSRAEATSPWASRGRVPIIAGIIPVGTHRGRRPRSPVLPGGPCEGNGLPPEPPTAR